MPKGFSTRSRLLAYAAKYLARPFLPCAGLCATGPDRSSRSYHFTYWPR